MGTTLLGAMVPESGKRQMAQDAALGAAQDALAARMIADAAEAGNPAAAAFADEAQELLGAVAVRRARARRLRRASARAAATGYSGMARCGADAAMVEDRSADRMAAAVCKAVRESHSRSAMGFVSPEEQRLLQQKSSLESMTQAQLESNFANLLKSMDASAINYGAEADDADELDDDAVEQLGYAAELFGGDLPSVFGSECYGLIFAASKSSADKLRKRLEKKQAKLAKLTEKLEDKEDEGKKGLNVKVLRLQIQKLEKSIAKIKGKLAKLDSTSDKADASERKAKKTEAAETQVVKEAIKDEDDDEEDEEADEEIGAACEVFGLRPRRIQRMQRRIARLRRRAERVRSPRRRRRLLARAARLERKLSQASVGAAAWSAHRQCRPIVVASTSEEFGGEDGIYADDEAMGEATGLPGGRAALVGYFAHRAATYGAEDYDAASFGAGFFESIADWFSSLWGGGKAAVERERSAAQAAREARAPWTPAVVAQRREVQAERKVLSQVSQMRRQAGRKAARASRGKGGAPASAPAMVAQPTAQEIPGAGGYLYRYNPDRSITILKAPGGKGQGTTLRSGTAYEAILREIGPSVTVGAEMGPLETIVRAPKGERGALIAQRLDAALAQYAPLSSSSDDDGANGEEDDEDDDLGALRRRAPGPSPRRPPRRERRIERLESREHLNPVAQARLARMKQVDAKADRYWSNR